MLTRRPRPAFMYLMPTAHNPLGISLPMAKRESLAQLARDFQVPIVEDDPYGELSYDIERPPPLRSLEEDWVYYVGSFSKILAPSLRVGWIVAPKEHVHALSVIKEGLDLNVNTFSQWVVNEYFEHNDIFQHIEKLRNTYRERRDAMHAALKANLASLAQWRIPDSGIFYWLKFPETIDTSRLLADCLEQERVAFLPSEACSRGKRRNGMRLNFSRCEPDQIGDAVARISRVLARTLEQPGRVAERRPPGRDRD